MKKIIGIFFLMFLFLMSADMGKELVFGEENQESSRESSTENVEIGRLKTVLPSGWRFKIQKSNLRITRLTEEKPDFILAMDYPSVTCKEEVRPAQYVTESPSMVLYFHNKWNKDKWAAFDARVTGLKSSPEARIAPVLFCETDKYTIFRNTGVICPEKSNKEIEDYLKDYFKRYNDFGVNAIVRSIQEDEIKTTVYYYQFLFRPSGLPEDIKVYFISTGDPVLEKSPTDDFMKRFSKEPFLVKKVAECKLDGGVKDKITGLRGKICQVTDIKWINDNEVEVTGGIYYDLLAAGGYLFRVVLENDKWIVKEEKELWIS